MVRASDTDVLVILIGALGQQRREVWAMANIIMDCGMGNSRRYINVTNIADILEERTPGLPKALILLFADFQENPLANIKRVDCALLPPCRQTLEMKIHRTQYVTALWTHAMTTSPGDGLSPTDYGWSVSDNLLKPTWFKGPAIPDSLFTKGSNNIEDMEGEGDRKS